MSYILDALKKSETERNRGGAPSLLAMRQVHPGSNVGMWALLAALIINACLGGFWLLWRNEPESIAGNLPNAVPAAAPDASAPIAQMPLPARPAIAAPTAVMNDSTTKTMELPDFTFSSHIYSDDDTMRAVTLNGRRLLQGDTISTGVRLKEITETGVVLDVNGRAVPLEVLQDWR